MERENQPVSGSSENDDSLETTLPNSVVDKARAALYEVRDRVAESSSGATETEIARQVGDYEADKLIQDADQAVADEVINPEEAATLQQDGAEVLLQGGTEDELSISLEDNPATRVTEAEHEGVLENAATAISREDAESGTQAAILLGRAEETR
jgi:hypothetical protein